MEIKKADMNDIDLLIKLRIDYINEESHILSQNELTDISKKLKDYFCKHMADDGFIAVIAFEGSKVLSTAFLSSAERPPRDAFMSYRVGTIYNVYTYPEYRRKGIAAKVVTALIEEARKADVATIDLSATDSGRPLYDKLGFNVSKYAAMRLKLQ